MTPALRAVVPFSVFIFAGSLPLPAQDIAVRVEAVRLLERANAVSRTTHAMPNYRHDLTFRA
jgi:hypothetical protein